MAMLLPFPLGWLDDLMVSEFPIKAVLLHIPSSSITEFSFLYVLATAWNPFCP